MTKQDFIAKHGARAYKDLVQHPNPNVEKMMVKNGAERKGCEIGDVLIEKVLKLLGLKTNNILEAQQLIKNKRKRK